MKIVKLITLVLLITVLSIYIVYLFVSALNMNYMIRNLKNIQSKYVAVRNRVRLIAYMEDNL